MIDTGPRSSPFLKAKALEALDAAKFFWGLEGFQVRPCRALEGFRESP